MSVPTTSKIITPKTDKGRTKLENIFIDAVVQGRINKVKDCLKKGADPNFIGEDGDAALHIVSETGHIPMAKTLMDSRDIDLNIMNHMNMTPLMIASFSSQRKVLQELLRRGADPNFPNRNGNRALHIACTTRDVQIIFDLMTQGAEVNHMRNVFDVTPLTIAAIDRPSSLITRYLLKKGAFLTGSKEFPLLLECALSCHTHEQLEVFTILLKYGMELNQVHPIEKKNCLHYVAMTGYVPLGEYILGEGIDYEALDATGRTALQIAEVHKNSGIVKLLKGWQRRRVNFVDLATEIEIMEITPSIFLPKKSVRVCSKCNQYLSVGPITISFGKPVCGRCSPNTDCPALFYENLAEYMYFPCINDRFGCDAMLAWKTVSSHEKKCLFFPVDCPALDCNKKIKKEKILEHFTKHHEELIIDGNQLSMSTKEQHQSVNKLLLLEKKTLILKMHFNPPFCHCSVSSWNKINGEELKCDILMTDDGNQYSSYVRNVPIRTYKEKQQNPSTMTEIGLYIIQNMCNVEATILTINILKKPIADAVLNNNLLSELECPICTNYMKPPIPMCPIGHSICNCCRSNISKCPLCLMEMKENRNFVLERLTGHIVFPCKFETYGCSFAGTLPSIHTHELNCHFGVTINEQECCVNHLSPCPWRGPRSEAIVHLSKVHPTFYVDIKKPLVIHLKQFKVMKGFTEYNSRIFKIHIEIEKTAGFNIDVKFISSNKKKNYRYFLTFIDRNKNHRFLSLNKFCNRSEAHKETLNESLFIKKQMFKPFTKNDTLEFKLNIVEI